MDADGEIVDALTLRLASAICCDGVTVSAVDHLERVRSVVAVRA